MSRDHAIKGIRYYDCDLCGFTYRITDTTLNSAGLRVCYDHDVDQSDYKFFKRTSVFDPNLPLFYDKTNDSYYQLYSNALVLKAIMVEDIDIQPPVYMIGDYSANQIYQLVMDGGKLYIKEGVYGKKFPFLLDITLGTYQMLHVLVDPLDGVAKLYFKEV